MEEVLGTEETKRISAHRVTEDNGNDELRHETGVLTGYGDG